MGTEDGEAAGMNGRKEGVSSDRAVWGLARAEAWFLYLVFFNSMVIEGGSIGRLDRKMRPAHTGPRKPLRSHRWF